MFEDLFRFTNLAHQILYSIHRSQSDFTFIQYPGRRVRPLRTELTHLPLYTHSPGLARSSCRSAPTHHTSLNQTGLWGFVSHLVCLLRSDLLALSTNSSLYSAGRAQTRRGPEALFSPPPSMTSLCLPTSISTASDLTLCLLLSVFTLRWLVRYLRRWKYFRCSDPRNPDINLQRTVVFAITLMSCVRQGFGILQSCDQAPTGEQVDRSE